MAVEEAARLKAYQRAHRADDIGMYATMFCDGAAWQKEQDAAEICELTSQRNEATEELTAVRDSYGLYVKRASEAAKASEAKIAELQEEVGDLEHRCRQYVEELEIERKVHREVVADREAEIKSLWEDKSLLEQQNSDFRQNIVFLSCQNENNWKEKVEARGKVEQLEAEVARLREEAVPQGWVSHPIGNIGPHHFVYDYPAPNCCNAYYHAGDEPDCPICHPTEAK